MTWPIGEARLFRWDHATSRPRLLVLLLLGWTIVGFDDRYCSTLLGRRIMRARGEKPLVPGEG